jgi:hypothetical protein
MMWLDYAYLITVYYVRSAPDDQQQIIVRSYWQGIDDHSVFS